MSSIIDPGNATDAYIARELGVESPRDVREDVDTLTAFGTPGKQKRLRVSTIRELMAVLHDLGLITNDYREPITLPASVGGGGGAVSSVSDSASIDMTLFSGNLSAVAIFGTASGTVAEGDHTHTGVYAPVSHTHPESDITGLVADLAGKANVSHTHAAADIASGTIAPARLGSGSGGATKFLREDSTWQTVSSGGLTPAQVLGRVWWGG